MEKANADEVLTVAEVARKLKCSKSHVYKVIRREVRGVTRLSAIRMGTRRLIRRSSLERWKRENELGVVHR